jgi:hypothetical protein
MMVMNPSVWQYLITWNETKYQANNTTGWQAAKSNDMQCSLI